MTKKKSEDIEIRMDDVEDTAPSQAARKFILAIQHIQNCVECDKGVCKDHWEEWAESKKEVFGS